MKKTLTPIAIAAALSLAPAAAWAEVQDRSGGYAVVGLGKTKTEANGKKIDVNQSKPKVGNGKFNYTVGGGYRLNDYFAIETNVHGQAGDRKKKSSRDKNPKSNGEVGSLAGKVSSCRFMRIFCSVWGKPRKRRSWWIKCFFLAAKIPKF